MVSGFRHRPGFRIPTLDIPDSKEKISRIPDSGLPYMGRYFDLVICFERELRSRSQASLCIFETGRFELYPPRATPSCHLLASVAISMKHKKFLPSKIGPGSFTVDLGITPLSALLSRVFQTGIPFCCCFGEILCMLHVGRYFSGIHD